MAASQHLRVQTKADGYGPMIDKNQTFRSITEQISSIVVRQRPPLMWYIGTGLSFILVLILMGAVTYLLLRGIGIWGVNVPVAWGFAITNFVWWIGIGHAGTLISAILLPLAQHWRNSINRFAEAMTLFAVICAGLFPLLHLGRPWMFYYLIPYPATMGTWPQFRSPLVWDIFAVSTYLTVSLVFWYIGLIPDMATVRDRAPKRWQQIIFGILCFGWRGSSYHWKRYEMTYLLLAGLATPLVLSVHTVVSFDFTISILPGWHSTFFPPYFVAGAIYSGFAMVLMLAIPIRSLYHLEDVITPRHINNCARLMLVTGIIVLYSYVMETFIAWYSGDPYEWAMMKFRMFGPYGWVYWVLVVFNLAIPQLVWLRRIRRNNIALFLISMSVLVGMWLERFVIVIQSLSQDFLPSSWGIYRPTIWDWAVLFGTVGLFTFLMLLFLRLLPMISMSEVRRMLPAAEVHLEPEREKAARLVEAGQEEVPSS